MSNLVILCLYYGHVIPSHSCCVCRRTHFMGTMHWNWSSGISLPGLTSLTYQLHRFIICLGNGGVPLAHSCEILMAFLNLAILDISFSWNEEAVKEENDVWTPRTLNSDLQSEVNNAESALQVNSRTLNGMNGTKSKIFECVRLLEVEESQPAAGGELPIHGIGQPRLATKLKLCFHSHTQTRSYLRQ